MIKAVFFDFDGVLTMDRTGSLTTNRYLSRVTGIPLSTVDAVFGRYNDALTLGQTSYARIWQEIGRELGRELSIDLLYEAFASTPLNARMFALARRLQKGYSVAIITDNKKERIAHLKTSADLESLFDPIVVSAEVGARKDSVTIFQHALRRAGASAEESVFVDNDPRNLLAPRALGMHAIFHDDARNDVEHLLATLQALGVSAEPA